MRATRRTRPGRLPYDLAAGLIRTWTRFKVQEVTVGSLTPRWRSRRHGFSYWDSAMIASARALGCRTLYAEDMSHAREVEGFVIVNPFR